ncbi:MAG: nitrous oxide reductase family maturation protein NosD [Promethearchaeota archaeon]
MLSNISNSSIYIDIKNHQKSEKEYQNHIKPSGFWNLTAPIFIDDLDPNYNWSKTVLENDWCSGSGTWTDPYVIENVTIDGQGLGNCIAIMRSDAYFVIRNCSLYNSGLESFCSGLNLWLVDNGKIINITSNDNNLGMYLSSCSNLTLSDNTVSNNFRGISLSDCNSITLIGNVMNYCGIDLWGFPTDLTSHVIDDTNLVNSKPVYYYVNKMGLRPSNFTNAGQIILINCSNSIITEFNLPNGTVGISLHYSNNNTLSSNILKNNNEYGIYLRYSNNNTLLGNNASSNYYGIYLRYSDNNTLLLNNASNNYHGIELTFSNDNTLSGNIAKYNIYGIDLSLSDNNTLSGNLANNNNVSGIVLERSNNNTLMGNIANNNNDYGILAYDNKNNIISRNTVNYNNYGITLENSNNNLYFKNIANNNDQDGMNLWMSHNNIFMENNASYNYGCGIDLHDGNNNTLLRNNVIWNNYGVIIGNCSNNLFSENTISNNNYYGVNLYDVHNSTLSENTVNFNNNGMRVAKSNNNIFLGNIADNNNEYAIILKNSKDNKFFGNLMIYCGISLIGSLEEIGSHIIDTTNLINYKPVYYYVNKIGLGSSYFTNAGQVILINCSNSIISKLNISDGSEIFLGYSNNNTILENRIETNKYGIRLDSNSNNNQVFLNNFTNNEINAEDNGTNNKWDNSIIGNYWYDYNGVDANDDGIGDTPYIIYGSAKSQDNFPIWEDGDEILDDAPRISFGKYYILFTLITIFFLIIFKKQKKK